MRAEEGGSPTMRVRGQRLAASERGWKWSECMKKARTRPGFLWSECVKGRARSVVGKLKDTSS